MQNYIVYALVAFCAIYIGRKVYRSMSGKASGCEGCSKNCASKKKDK